LLGNWGERKAQALLLRAGFSKLRDLNAERFNHPFGDIYAERRGARYMIGVKTRNKYQISGILNSTYNIKKKGADLTVVAESYNAQLAWVAIQVIPERQVFWSYFGTIADMEEHGERFSIPMNSSDTFKYERLADEEHDQTLLVGWSNGGFRRSRDRRPRGD
jgi:hypothetical protein